MSWHCLTIQVLDAGAFRESTQNHARAMESKCAGACRFLLPGAGLEAVAALQPLGSRAESSSLVKTVEPPQFVSPSLAASSGRYAVEPLASPEQLQWLARSRCLLRSRGLHARAGTRFQRSGRGLRLARQHRLRIAIAFWTSACSPDSLEDQLGGSRKPRRSRPARCTPSLAVASAKRNVSG